MNRRRATMLAALAVAVGLALPPRPSAQGALTGGSLTGAAQVARTYDAIMDARFTEIPSLLADTCPPAPPDACRLLSLVSLWWQMQQDPLNRRPDRAFETQADDVIDLIDRWTTREPARAEAWFYLGGAIGARAQWRVLRGQTLAAARDGKRIKTALERALALDPALQDAYFGIGLYHYYADVAPAFAKMLRWLFLLPGGTASKGFGRCCARGVAGNSCAARPTISSTWCTCGTRNSPSGQSRYSPPLPLDTRTTRIFFSKSPKSRMVTR